ASRRRGFVVGRMLRQGCVVPAIGGGLCQLSNALYGLALKSGCEIVERHAHSIKMPGAPVDDATVAWNYVDLRFRVREQTRIKAWMSGEELIVEWQTGYSSVVTSSGRWRLEQIVETRSSLKVQSCASCGVTNCFRHEAPRVAAYEERTGYLVDSDSPELDDYIRRVRRSGDVLVLKGARRSHSVESMAVEFAQALRPDVTHLCVSQAVLPWLWRMGAMGGRTFDVFMSAEQVPMSDPWLVQDMEEALKFARRLIFQAELGTTPTIQTQSETETIGA
ncbi:MAG TPA: VanW family protein, partial [Granulicella sp.]